jgi:hypothetical protein
MAASLTVELWRCKREMATSNQLLLWQGSKSRLHNSSTSRPDARMGCAAIGFRTFSRM